MNSDCKTAFQVGNIYDIDLEGIGHCCVGITRSVAIVAISNRIASTVLRSPQPSGDHRQLVLFDEG